MGYEVPQVEIIDAAGSTTPFVGVATLTPANVPSSAANSIEEIWIKASNDQPKQRRLEFSFDAGTTYHRIEIGEEKYYEPRGSITQILVRAAGQSVTETEYEIIMNRGTSVNA